MWARHFPAMKTLQHFSTSVLPVMLIVRSRRGLLRSAGHQVHEQKKDSGASTTGTGSSGSCRLGANPINAAGGSGPVVRQADLRGAVAAEVPAVEWQRDCP